MYVHINRVLVIRIFWEQHNNSLSVCNLGQNNGRILHCSRFREDPTQFQPCDFDIDNPRSGMYRLQLNSSILYFYDIHYVLMKRNMAD